MPNPQEQIIPSILTYPLQQVKRTLYRNVHSQDARLGTPYRSGLSLAHRFQTSHPRVRDNIRSCQATHVVQGACVSPVTTTPHAICSTLNLFVLSALSFRVYSRVSTDMSIRGEFLYISSRESGFSHLQAASSDVCSLTSKHMKLTYFNTVTWSSSRRGRLNCCQA
ncbi:unnamed protein product [Periconia digitata]|uniref:Uncharacterized protein n=1 Tax=Periconia digitata TaxID=1303443 RepID=A0A9W4UPZ5_9PLEO|nr:unnamed protein product [Periconia digitata]